MILEEASDAHSLCLDDTAVAAKVWPALAESPMAFGTEGSAHRNETLDEPENEFILEMPPPPKEETNTENWCLHHDDEANRCNNLSAQQHYDGEKLAVAVAITDDFEYATRADEDSCLPCAVELDPDSEGGRGVRNSLLSSYRLRVSAIAFLVVVVVVVVVGTTVVLRTAQKDHGSKDRSTLGIRQAVEAVVGGENLLEETGPYGKALDWITYSDPTEPKPEQSNFLQRYLAVYFYFATSAEREWNACARPRVNDVDDCFFSVSVSQQKGDTLTSDILGYRWLSKRNECLWIGVTCNKEDQIVVLNLGALLS